MEAHRGRFEVAIFERPFWANGGRPPRDVIQDLGGEPSGNGRGAPKGAKPRRLWPRRRRARSRV